MSILSLPPPTQVQTQRENARKDMRTPKSARKPATSTTVPCTPQDENSTTLQNISARKERIARRSALATLKQKRKAKTPVVKCRNKPQGAFDTPNKQTGSLTRVSKLKHSSAFVALLEPICLLRGQTPEAKEAQRLALQCLGSLAVCSQTAHLIIKGPMLPRLVDSALPRDKRNASQPNAQFLQGSLELLARLAFTEAGRQALYKSLVEQDRLDHLFSLIESKAGAVRLHAICVVRNLSFHGAAKTSLLSSDHLLPLLLSILRNRESKFAHQTPENSNEKLIRLYAASTLWSLVYNNQKGVALVKSKLVNVMCSVGAKKSATTFEELLPRDTGLHKDTSESYRKDDGEVDSLLARMHENIRAYVEC